MTRDRAEAMAVRASRRRGVPMFISEWHGDWVVSNYRLRTGATVVEIGAQGAIPERKDVEQVRFADLLEPAGDPWAVAPSPRSGNGADRSAPRDAIGDAAAGEERGRRRGAGETQDLVDVDVGTLRDPQIVVSILPPACRGRS